jgi:formylglycine-generating enzyme required for sulfatase activity
MSFRPAPEDELSIGDRTYRFAEHPAAPGMAYGQSGRRGTVYQLVDENDTAWALKVFLPQFSEPRLVGQSERIRPLATLPGLKACARDVLSSSRHVDLIRDHSDLDYAVLMPWISGLTWMEVVLNKEPVSVEEALSRTRTLVHVLLGMEERGLTHCDLSGPNVILESDGGIELVDLEEMYGPDLVRPKSLPGGSSGYAHKTAPEGLWRDEADRFAGAVLLAEMLCWSDKRVRETAWGEGYFDPDEMQTNCERFHLIKSVFQERWGDDLARSFDAVWFSDTLLTCPTFSKWLAALPEEVPERGSLAKSIDVLSLELKETTDVDDSALEEKEVHGADVQDVEEETLAPTEDETWTCPTCGREVGSGLRVCPCCEEGSRDQLEELSQPPEVESRAPMVKVEGKRSSVWAFAGVVLAFIVLVGGGGGILVMRSQSGRATEPAIVIAVAETATARLPEKPTPTAAQTFTPTLTPTITQIPTSTLGIGSTMMSDVDGMVMVYVPEGAFLMGWGYASYIRRVEERPQHTIYLDAFWIDQTEVTNAMYARCVEDGTCDPPSSYTSNKRSSYYDNASYSDYPVIYVRWDQALEYCEWSGRRLPTEAEWEKAARGEDGWVYPWGDLLPDCNLANYHICKRNTDEVGSYLSGASPYGALDMAGNVWEWVADWYDPGYYERSPSENPQGPPSGTERVQRGGSWTYYDDYIRTTVRTGWNPASSAFNIGFRCARGDSP